MSDTQPFVTPKWSLSADRTVLILIDLQNDVLSDDGWYAKSGVDIKHMPVSYTHLTLPTNREV